ncbi:hypothetical protein GQ472_01990 [archaeon]|nr:hypothetical protein [archaeon]
MRYSIVLSALMTAILLLSMPAYAVPALTIDSPQNISYSTVSIPLSLSSSIGYDDVKYRLNDNEYTYAIKWLADESKRAGVTGQYISSYTGLYKDSTQYLIQGYGGSFHGYNWTGTAWLSDTAIVTGLGTYYTYESNTVPSGQTVFNISDIWYFIKGNETNDLIGYNWTGSSWQEDSAIVSGLDGAYGTYTRHADPVVFDIDDVSYMLIYRSDSNVFGFNWTGTAWQSDDSIRPSPEAPAGVNYAQPEAFKFNDVQYLLISASSFAPYVAVGYMYNSTTGSWQSDAGHIDEGVVSRMYLDTTVYDIDGYHYLLSGNKYYNMDTGFRWDIYNSTLTAVEGINKIYMYSVTYAGLVEDETIYFTVDTIVPTIDFIAPTPDDSSTVQTASMTVNLSVIDADIDTVTLNWNGTNETVTGFETVKTFGADGSYTYYACVNDTAGNINCTDTRAVTSEYQSYQAYLESIATITATKAIGEVPAGAILGLTENLAISDAIYMGILAIIIGFSIFVFSEASNRKS